MEQHDLIQKALNTIRFLAVDAVEKAKSGHPGTPMGSAEIAYTLWMRHMKYNPSNPKWVNRDRFVLSAGHASMLLYSMLYLTGYDLTLDDIKQFRQLDSRTPGHPEYGCTPGVETTTGPLGQGIATSIGMMIGERYLGAWFNRPGYDLIDYHIYVFCSDGDMMEGISSEAASLAGHLGLSKLICIYSDNKISIEGNTDLAFTEDVGKRFEAYGWYVQDIDGHDMAAIDEALANAKSQSEKPSMIHAHCHIGYGSPDKQDSADAHGEPLGAEETIRAKTNLGWPIEPAFLVPDDVLNHMRTRIDEGKTLEDKWNRQFQLYAEEYIDLADEWTKSMAGKFP
ncbi:MAG: transketolase family protein, partial [Armatimonadota bacterium]